MTDQTNPLRTTTALLGLSSTILLAGINIGTSALFIPHLLSPSLSIETTTAIFTRLYHDGAKLVVPLAAAGTLSFGLLAADLPFLRASPGAVSLGTSVGGSSTPRIFLGTASALVVSTLAWTMIVVMPVNNRLMDIAASSSSTAANKNGGGGGSGEKKATAAQSQSQSQGQQRDEVDGLLRSWQWMNYVRGFGALAAGLLALGTLVV